MRTNKTFFLLLTFVVIFSFTGCYTQVATSDTSSVPDYEETSEVANYYSEDDGESGYYSETDIDTLDEETIIINNYYEGYPYRSYYVDYYPTITIGFGFGWGWGYWGYYPYYSYWPYYAGWYGWGCYYPYYYSYYPGYYYDPYYYPYYGSGGYYSDYGYKTRSEYVSGVRNNSGGRNYGERNRDPLVSVRDGLIDRSRENLTRDRDLTVSRNNVKDRTLGIENKTRDLTREVVGLNTTSRTIDTKRNNDSEREINRTSDVRNNKQLGLDREVSTNKTLGINKRNDVSSETVKRNSDNISERINKNDRVSNETKKLFGKDNSRTNTNTKQPNVNNRTNKNQTPKKDNNTRTYSPPKSNNNSPKSYSPPKSNNNTPRSYSPPKSNNNTPRSYSPPSGNSGNRGSNNFGSRNRR
jgi:hypothetical protein